MIISYTTLKYLNGVKWKTFTSVGPSPFQPIDYRPLDPIWAVMMVRKLVPIRKSILSITSAVLWTINGAIFCHLRRRTEMSQSSFLHLFSSFLKEMLKKLLKVKSGRSERGRWWCDGWLSQRLCSFNHVVNFGGRACCHNCNLLTKKRVLKTNTNITKINYGYLYLFKLLLLYISS